VVGLLWGRKAGGRVEEESFKRRDKNQSPPWAKNSRVLALVRGEKYSFLKGTAGEGGEVGRGDKETSSKECKNA